MPRSATLKARPKPDRVATRTWRFEAIGTAWSIDIYEAVAAPAWQRLQAVITQRIERFDADYSRFRADSLVTRMSQRAGTYRLPDDGQPLFDLYAQLYKLTAGAMTPLIGQTLAAAGYDASYSLRPGPLTAPPTWEAALSYHYPHLTLHRPALLDVGGAGKGYLVDLIAAIIQAAGISAFCVNAGGDLTVRGVTDPLAVGLENPHNPRQAIGVAAITNGSLCGSAGNRRAWGAFHHIMNPHALSSPRHLDAVWVYADTTLLADALTTALYFVAPHRLAPRFPFEWALLRDGQLTRSAHFPAEFFTENPA